MIPVREKLIDRTGEARRKKILVVDDDEAIRSLCSEVLTVAGYQVLTACDGQDALDMMKDSPFDLVISDVDMPRLDGVSFFTYALREHPYIEKRFLFITGNNTEECASSLRRTGAMVLKKPFRITELISRVEKVMSGALNVIEGGRDKVRMGARQEDRIGWVSCCEMSTSTLGSPGFIVAETENLSRNGAKVRFRGSPLAVNECFGVNIHLDILNMDLKRSARVVWSKPADDGSSEAGVVFAKPVPASSIINLMPATRQC